jgi:hypothetical protein
LREEQVHDAVLPQVTFVVVKRIVLEFVMAKGQAVTARGGTKKHAEVDQQMSYSSMTSFLRLGNGK